MLSVRLEDISDDLVVDIPCVTDVTGVFEFPGVLDDGLGAGAGACVTFGKLVLKGVFEDVIVLDIVVD